MVISCFGHRVGRRLPAVAIATHRLWYPHEEFADLDIPDVTRHEWIAWTPMIALILAIGIYPNLIFRVTDGAVDASLNECLQVNTQEMSAEDIEALHCAPVYNFG